MDAILSEIQAQLDRVERKLDVLIEALAEEEDEQAVGRTLDGDAFSTAERDQTQAL